MAGPKVHEENNVLRRRSGGSWNKVLAWLHSIYGAAHRRIKYVRLGLAVLLCGLISVAIVDGNSRPAWAEPAPTMRFNSVLDVAGLLSAITVTPASVTVDAHSDVDFVNGTAAPLTLRALNQEFWLAPQQTHTISFAGGAAAQDVSVTATAINLPIVGTLTSSVGMVHVRAQEPNGQPSSDEPPASSPPVRRDSSGSDHPLPPPPVGPREFAPAAPAAPSDGSARSTTPSPSGAASPSLEEQSRSALREHHSHDSAAKLGNAGYAMPETRGGGWSASTLGLFIAVAALLLMGVGAAGLRTVGAFRRVGGRR